MIRRIWKVLNNQHIKSISYTDQLDIKSIRCNQHDKIILRMIYSKSENI